MANNISLTNIKLYIQEEAKGTASGDDICQINSIWTQCDTEDEQGNKVNEGDGNLNKNELPKFIARLMTTSKKLYNIFTSFLHSKPETSEALESLKSTVTVDEESGMEIFYDGNGHISRIVDNTKGTDVSYITNLENGNILMDTDTNNEENYRTYDEDGVLGSITEDGVEKIYFTKEDGTRFLLQETDDNTMTSIMYREDGSIYSKENFGTNEMLYYDKNNQLLSIQHNKYVDLPNDGTQLSSDSIANNLRLLYSYLKNTNIDQEKGIKDMMSLINADNYYDISNSAEDLNMDSHIFSKFAVFYDGNDKTEILTEKFQMFLAKAKEKNVYTKDFEENFDIAKNDATKLAQMLERLATRLGCNEYAANREVSHPNGEIDGDFRQGYTGDCWLIASIISINNNPELKAKLDDMVNVVYAEDGVTVREVIVNIKGKDYKISAEELNGAVEYSSGDLDIRAIEIAVNRYCFENNLSDINEGGYGKTAFEILFDDVTVISYKNISDENFDVLKQYNIIAVTRIAESEDISQKSGFTGKDSDGNTINIVPHHVYSISKVDNNYVYLTNPWESDSIIQMNIDDFKIAFNGFDYIQT